MYVNSQRRVTTVVSVAGTVTEAVTLGIHGEMVNALHKVMANIVHFADIAHISEVLESFAHGVENIALLKKSLNSRKEIGMQAICPATCPKPSLTKLCKMATLAPNLVLLHQLWPQPQSIQSS